MIGYGNSMFLATHGILARSASGGAVDPDAQAFITAASITDPTQQSAINQLVVDLKGYGVWTKMKAIYPFVGGTNAQHAWNLKDTTQYKITWYGGVTSSSNGVIGNALNAYGDTFLNNNVMTQNDAHISLYSRTSTSESSYDMGSWNGSIFGSFIRARAGGNFQATINSSGYFAQSNSDGRGLYLVTRKNNSVQTAQKNTAQYASSIGSNSNITTSFKILRVGEYNAEYSSRTLAFASIGDGLTDTEAANFYTAVQAFQVTLGRSIGTQTVSDADAQAFVTNAGIVDQVEANAINNLVIGLKADSLWTKMKAVYPFVGSSASTHKFNLKDPQDTDGAFRLVFSGGVTHSFTGALFNGTNGFADTKLASNGTLAQNSTHFSAYSRTNNQIGGYIIANGSASASGEAKMFTRWFDNNCYSGVNTFGQTPTANSDSRGYFIANRISATQHSVVIRGTKTDFNTNSSGLKTDTFRICSALNVSYDNKEIAFASIGDGLNATELNNLNSRVVTFETTLNRNV